MTEHRQICSHCGAVIEDKPTEQPGEPADEVAKPGPEWAKAFGGEYYAPVERKAELVAQLGLLEDISYKNDMMPSFWLRVLAWETSDEGMPLNLKLWCGFNDDQSDQFIASVCLTDEDDQWLCDLGTIETVVGLLTGSGVEVQLAEQSEDSIIKALQAFQQIDITAEHEALLIKQYQVVTAI